MIWPEVALSAGTRLSGNRHRTRMACVTGRAVTDCAVVIGFADAVALLASAGHCRWPFESGERVRRTPDSSRLVSLGKIHLFRSKCFVSTNRSPRYGSVAAAEELLINIFMAASAISCRQVGDNGESIVFFALLIIRRLVAVEAINPLLRMLAHFVFVNNRVLRARVAFGTLSRSAHELRLWLFRLNSGACAVNQQCRQHQREGN